MCLLKKLFIMYVAYIAFPLSDIQSSTPCNGGEVRI